MRCYFRSYSSSPRCKKKKKKKALVVVHSNQWVIKLLWNWLRSRYAVSLKSPSGCLTVTMICLLSSVQSECRWSLLVYFAQRLENIKCMQQIQELRVREVIVERLWFSSPACVSSLCPLPHSLWCSLHLFCPLLPRPSSSVVLTHPSAVRCGPSCCTTTATTPLHRRGRRGDCRNEATIMTSSREGEEHMFLTSATKQRRM